MHRAIVQTAVNPYVVLDGTGEVIWCSDRIEALLGFPAVSVVGRHFLDIVHPSSHEAVLAQYARFREEHERRRWLGPPMLLDLTHDAAVDALAADAWCREEGEPCGDAVLGEGSGLVSCWPIPVTVRGDVRPTAAVFLFGSSPIAPSSHSTTVERVATLVPSPSSPTATALPGVAPPSPTG